jgi:hypothetical protein
MRTVTVVVVMLTGLLLLCATLHVAGFPVEPGMTTGGRERQQGVGSGRSVWSTTSVLVSSVNA